LAKTGNESFIKATGCSVVERLRGSDGLEDQFFRSSKAQAP